MKKLLPRLISVLGIFIPYLAAKLALRYFATPTRIPRPKSEEQIYESSKKYFLKCGYAAFEWGNAHDPIVLLIHGWNGRGTQIGQFANSLVENNFRVIALDGPGHGDSPGKMTTPTHYAQFITDVQKELDPSGVHAVIAHSFGGGCTVYAASKNLKVKCLILIASPAFYNRVVDFFAKSMGLKNKSKGLFIEMVTKLSGIHPSELDIGKIGTALKLPVLIVHDEGDLAVNFESATAIHNSWPGSKLLKTQGLGHRRILKDSKVIKDVTDFIKSV